MKLNHIFELAMHPTALNAMGRHLADKVKVGYEFEFAVVPGTPLYPKDQPSNMGAISINEISSYDDFYKYFDLSTKHEENINNDYYDHIAPMIHKYAEAHWQEYDNNYQDGYDLASEDYASDKLNYSLDDYIKDNIEDIISQYRLEPLYGWADEHHEYLYSGESRDDYDNAVALTKQSVKQSLDSMFPGANIAIRDSGPVDEWRVMVDTSISSIKDSAGIEVATAPYPLHEALAVLQRMFDWMNHNKVITNKTTGLHINVSVAGDPNQIDLVKLALFLGEKYSMEQFNRITNNFAKSQYDRLLKAIIDDNTPDEKTLSAKNIKKIIAMLRSSISADKYFSFNINNLKDKGYIEFRIPGNENYHAEYEKARDTTLRYAVALAIASDENAHKQEYYKKIAQLFSKSLQGFGWNQPESLNIDWKFVEKMNSSPAFRIAFRGFRNSYQHEKTAAIHFIIQMMIAIYQYNNNISKDDILFITSLTRIAKTNRETISQTLKRTARNISPKLSITDIANIIRDFQLQ